MVDRYPPLIVGEFVTTPLGQRVLFWRHMGKVKMPRLITCPDDVLRMRFLSRISSQQLDEELKRWH